MDHQTTRSLANNIVSKPQVPALNFSRHDGYGSSDQSMTARAAVHGPGSLPHVQRGSVTSRQGFAQTAAGQQYAGNDAIRTTAAAETGPITPAQALKRYGEYLTAYEQSEILQYTQVCQMVCSEEKHLGDSCACGVQNSSRQQKHFSSNAGDRSAGEILATVPLHYRMLLRRHQLRCNSA